MKNITTIKKLSAMPYAQAHIEIDEEGNICLFSYVTLVAQINADGWLSVNGLYSQTTRRHISAFVKEYASPLTYQSAKFCYENNKTINRFTGEMEDLE